MKSPLAVIVPLILTTQVHADLLSSFSPFLGSSRPDYDPAKIEAEGALENPTQAPFSPADSDFGVQQILSPHSGRAPIDVSLDASLNYIDNAPSTALTGDEASWYTANRLAASWRPRISHGWFADVGVAQDIFSFENSDTTDFENFQPHLGLVKSIPDLDDLVFFSRYEYQRITTGSLSDASFNVQRIRVGFQKDLLLSSHYLLSAGLDTALNLTADPASQERNDYSAGLSYTYWFTDKLYSTLSWKGTYWDFKQGGREDWNHIVGLELTWSLSEHNRIFTNVFYTNHDSNAAFGANDFNAWQGGIGFGLNHSF
jgi:hypothetical protein